MRTLDRLLRPGLDERDEDVIDELAEGLDPGDHCGPAGREYGQAPACPSRSAARPRAGDRHSLPTREKTLLLTAGKQKEQTFE